MCKIPTDYHELDTMFNHIVTQQLKTVGFTSASRHTGVTSLIKSLAYRCQVAGMRTVIVDTNCHNSEFSRMSPQEVWGNVSELETGIELLSLPILNQTNDWLMTLKNNKVIQNRLSELTSDYDVILIDTSAINNINRGNLPAERILGHCDGSYLVVKAGETRRAEIVHAMSIINASDVKLIGTVYNDVINPSLARELMRETHRLDNWLPMVSNWLRDKIQGSYLLNIML